jgi:hypothetical protein
MMNDESYVLASPLGAGGYDREYRIRNQGMMNEESYVLASPLGAGVMIVESRIRNKE